MEVHNHSHTSDPDMHRGRKKWTHYLWEFLMLFLAVFCGFLAENKREYIVERKREKQYLQSLYNDLRSDTAFINSFNDIGINYYDSLLEQQMNMISSGRFIKEAKTFYINAMSAVGVFYFEYNNSTFEQLRSSGNLRLLNNKELAKNLTNYDNLIREVIKKYEARYLEVNARLCAYQWQVLDVNFYKKSAGYEIASRDNAFTINNIPIFKEEDKAKLKLLNALYFEKRTMYPSYRGMIRSAKEMASKLIWTIKNDEDYSN